MAVMIKMDSKDNIYSADDGKLFWAFTELMNMVLW